MDGAFIVNLIQTVVFLTPLLVIFYKQGKKDRDIEEMRRDLNGMGKKLADVRDDFRETLEEVKAQTHNMSEVLIKITVSMEYIEKTLEELKENKHE